MKTVESSISKKRLIVFQKTAEQIKMKYRSSLFNKLSRVLFENRIGNKDQFFGRDDIPTL